MSSAGIKAQIGYRKPRQKEGTPSILTDNQLNGDFEPAGANQAWVNDITSTRTYEGWLYLAVVIDLFFRSVVGWSMQPIIQATLKNCLFAQTLCCA